MPHQPLCYNIPDKVFRTAVRGGARISDKYGKKNKPTEELMVKGGRPFPLHEQVRLPTKTQPRFVFRMWFTSNYNLMNGIITTDFGGSDSGRSVAIQSDGKIIVAGSTLNGGALARYNANGSLDTTFSGDGMVLITCFGRYFGVDSMTIQADGKIIVAGSLYSGNSSDFDLVRYNSDGSLDATFSGIADSIAPTVSTYSPADAATGVAVGGNIVLTFSKAIQKGMGNIVIHSGSADGTPVESYNAATSTNLTISGSTLTINPSTDLAAGTDYFVSLAAGSIKDLAGNSCEA